MRLSIPLVAFAVVGLAAYTPHAARPASATVPAAERPWENLQVLPDSLSRDQLIGIMRGFTDALGVQCGYCHVREDGEFVFPSDANPHKDVARGMMRMTWQINQEILPAIEGLHGNEDGEHGEGEHAGGGHGVEMRVTCYTCHRGAPEPATAVEATEEAGDHEHGEGAHGHGDQ